MFTTGSTITCHTISKSMPPPNVQPVLCPVGCSGRSLSQLPQSEEGMNNRPHSSRVGFEPTTFWPNRPPNKSTETSLK